MLVSPREAIGGQYLKLNLLDNTVIGILCLLYCKDLGVLER